MIDFNNSKQNFTLKLKNLIGTNFTQTNNLKRLLFFTIGIFVVVAFAWPVHTWALNSTRRTYNDGGFINVYIILNSGVSFGFGSNNSMFVYFLQITMVWALLIFVIFTRKWFYTLCVSLALGGGLFNVIDRMCPKDPVSISGGIQKDSVLDYFRFFEKSAIFNLPDVFILIGVITGSVIFFGFSVKEILDEKNLKGELPNMEKINIVFEDEDLIVVNKPNHLLIHQTTFNEKETLIDILRSKIKVNEFEDDARPGIVQRLDRDTTGLMVVAKNKKTATSLIEQIGENTLKRKYLAIIHGTFIEEEVVVKAPIGRSKRNKLKFIVTDDHKAKDAHTIITIVETFSNSSLVKCDLRTGRTHQIRVHLAYTHHPIYNDPIYGKNDGYENYGQFLHSAELSFTHPTSNQYLTFKAEPDAIFNELLAKLKTI